MLQDGDGKRRWPPAVPAGGGERCCWYGVSLEDAALELQAGYVPGWPGRRLVVDVRDRGDCVGGTAGGGWGTIGWRRRSRVRGMVQAAGRFRSADHGQRGRVHGIPRA